MFICIVWYFITVVFVSLLISASSDRGGDLITFKNRYWHDDPNPSQWLEKTFYFIGPMRNFPRYLLEISFLKAVLLELLSYCSYLVDKTWEVGKPGKMAWLSFQRGGMVPPFWTSLMKRNDFSGLTGVSCKVITLLHWKIKHNVFYHWIEGFLILLSLSSL